MKKIDKIDGCYHCPLRRKINENVYSSWISGLRYIVKDMFGDIYKIEISIHNINNGLDCIAKHGLANEIINIEVY